ncbi:MAG: hypothetical protein GY950_37190, partial [bacterium]|nr:hypothetical protein [bacterium]
MMKFKWIVFLLVVAMVSLCFAGEETKEKKPEPKGEHYGFNASLFYPVSINKTPYDSVNFNLTLFYSRVGRVSGFDLACIASVIKHNMKGVQITGAAGIAGDTVEGVQISGLFNVAGEGVEGLQAAGLINVAGDKLEGVQLAGIGNIAGDHASGVQGAGIFNITGETFTGVQGAAIFNITGETFTGIQAADIFNIVGENFKGVQAAGIFNITGGTLKGLQAAGIFNVAERVSGLQLGIVNIAGKVKGVQLGIVNLSKKIKGVPVGLVNLSKDGDIRWVTWGGSLAAVNTGVKFMVNRIYSIVAVGGINVYKDISEAISYGFYYGVHLPSKKFYAAMDLGYRTIDNKDFFKSTVG